MSKWVDKYQNIVLGILSTLLMFMILAVLLDRLVLPLYTKHGFEVEMPDITEFSYNQAKQFLKSDGFKMVIDTTKYSAVYPESTVIAQNPQPFSLVKRGRRIYVTLSAGEKSVYVPKVTGTSVNNVRFLLAQAELSLGEVNYEFNSYTPKDVVFRQSLIDTLVTKGTPVDITVSLGRAPTEIIVPNLVGKSHSLASKMIKESGLRVGEITYRVNSKLVADTVLEQQPAAGTKVSQYTPVRLVVSVLETVR